jgi:hypothetical protein
MQQRKTSLLIHDSWLFTTIILVSSTSTTLCQGRLQWFVNAFTYLSRCESSLSRTCECVSIVVYPADDITYHLQQSDSTHHCGQQLSENLVCEGPCETEGGPSVWSSLNHSCLVDAIAFWVDKWMEFFYLHLSLKYSVHEKLKKMTVWMTIVYLDTNAWQVPCWLFHVVSQSYFTANWRGNI